MDNYPKKRSTEDYGDSQKKVSVETGGSSGQRTGRDLGC